MKTWTRIAIAVVIAFACSSAYADDTNHLVPFPSPLTAASGGSGGGGGGVSGTCATTNAVAFFSAASTLSCDADWTWTPASNTMTFAADTAVSLGGGVDALNFASNLLSFDATNFRLGIGTAAPTAIVHAFRSAAAIDIVGESTATGQYAEALASADKASMSIQAFGSAFGGGLANVVRVRGDGAWTVAAGTGVAEMRIEITNAPTIATAGPMVFQFNDAITSREYLRFLDGASGTASAVFNENSLDRDFRVEGDNDANLIFGDASTDLLGFGDGSPGAKVEINPTGATTALIVDNLAQAQSIAVFKDNGTPVVTIADGGATTFTQQVTLGDGTAANPAWRFASAATGMHRTAAGRAAVDVAGNDVMEFAVGVASSQFNGSAAAPVWTYSTQESTGWYLNAAGDHRMSVAGADAIAATTSVITFHNAVLFHDVAPASITTGSCTAESLRTGSLESRGEVTATCTAQTWILVFTTTYNRAPDCVVTAMNAAASAGAATFTYTTSTTALTATVTTATTGGIWDYHCEE